MGEKEIISAALGDLLRNKPLGDMPLLEDDADIREKLLLLQQMHAELEAFAVQLTQGNLEAEPPSRKNYLAAGLKGLQAQIRHLTWQTQCVAEGDYNQRVDFMGEFSDAFNRMVEQLREREGKIISQQEFMMRLFDKLDPILVFTQDRSELLYANDAARKLFFQEEHAKEGSAFMQEIRTISAHESECQLQEEESGCWFNITFTSLPWRDENAAVMLYCRDITLHKERESNLETAANTDQLTNLGNRRAMEASLEADWALCGRSNKPLSILLFDIDHFKVYNDTYGHLQGDVCLAHVAGALSRNAARADDLIARYGGEEFVVMLPFTGVEHALRIADNIRRAVEEMEIPFKKPDGTEEITRVTISGGVSSTIPRPEIAPEQLLEAADLALYAAKRGGRNRISYRKPREADA